MECKGLWNLHINGKWFLYYRGRNRGRLGHPDDVMTLRQIKHLCEGYYRIERWEPVPFPSPLHSSLDYVYTVDIDAGTFTISKWSEPDALSAPSVAHLEMDLTKIYEISTISSGYDIMRKPPYLVSEDTSICESNKAQAKQFETFEIDFGFPTPMNELQERFFTDFVSLWRSYLDDPSAWRYNYPVFRSLCVAFLRLAAWDFEVSSSCSDNDSVYLPVTFASVPRWHYPDADVYWFHGYLVVLHDDIESTAMINGAVSKAESYIGDSRLRYDDVLLVIVISLRHLVFVELSSSREVVLASRRLLLRSNHSVTQCSSGFRALARILTSDCWKKPRAHGEKWPVNLPPEIIQMILHKLEPRDTIAFSQASLAAEQCYYASESQFKNIDVQNFKLSIPCCGKRTGLEARGVCCSECYAWQHLECVGLENYSSDYRYVCTGCQGRTEGLVESLQVRRSNSAHLRLELQSLRNTGSRVPLSLKDYTILFNDIFSGLVYGLEDSS